MLSIMRRIILSTLLLSLIHLAQYSVKGSAGNDSGMRTKERESSLFIYETEVSRVVLDESSASPNKYWEQRVCVMQGQAQLSGPVHALGEKALLN